MCAAALFYVVAQPEAEMRMRRKHVIPTRAECRGSYLMKYAGDDVFRFADSGSSHARDTARVFGLGGKLYSI